MKHDELLDKLQGITKEYPSAQFIFIVSDSGSEMIQFRRVNATIGRSYDLLAATLDGTISQINSVKENAKANQ